MSIKEYFENENKFWKVYVHVRSKTNRKIRSQRNTHGLKSLAEARREEKKLIRLASFEVQKAEGLGLCWDDVVHLWMEEVKTGYLLKVSERGSRGYLSIINKWTKHWSNRMASEITRADGRLLIEMLKEEKLSKAYQKKVKNIISNVYEWGIEFSYIVGPKHSPLKGLMIEKDQYRPPQILSLEEIKKFLSSAKILNHSWYPIWAFAILTGMRSGELHALTWDNIDLETNVLMVDKSYDSNSRIVGPTKARYWRTIPINKSLLNLINDIKLNSFGDSCPFVLPRSKDWDNGDQAVPLRNFLQSINMQVVKFHCLRACFATQMLASGVPAALVMKIGGWKRSATMDIYLRLAGVDTKGATDCLQFIPDEIDFSGNVVSLFESKKS
jgi:integrase